MTTKVRTEGEIRGFISRWLFRFEASSNILRIVFNGVTAASTLSAALALVGLQQYVPAALVGGVVGTVVFAFLYDVLGIYNRKNRERQDRGNNFAKPQNFIDDSMIARAILAGQKEEPLTPKERQAIEDELGRAFREYRSGIPIDE